MKKLMLNLDKSNTLTTDDRVHKIEELRHERIISIKYHKLYSSIAGSALREFRLSNLSDRDRITTVYIGKQYGIRRTRVDGHATRSQTLRHGYVRSTVT